MIFPYYSIILLIFLEYIFLLFLNGLFLIIAQYIICLIFSLVFEMRHAQDVNDDFQRVFSLVFCWGRGVARKCLWTKRVLDAMKDQYILHFQQ